jgi:hypothetical protein
MTFEEAKNIKRSLPEKVIINKTEMGVYIVPLDELDYIKFAEFYMKYNITDETAKKFSKNKQFDIRGLYRLETWRLYATLQNIIDTCDKT